MIDASYKPLSALTMYEYCDLYERSDNDQHEGIRSDFEMNFGPALLRLFDHILSMRHFAGELERMSSALIDSMDKEDDVATRRLGFKLIEGGRDDLF